MRRLLEVPIIAPRMTLAVMVAVTLLHRKGYFYQRLDQEGNQTEEPSEWAVEDFLELQAPTVQVTLAGREVMIRAWLYKMTGCAGRVVPVLLLDTDLEQNHPDDRTFTHRLYGGDQRYRLCQEVILGIGGVRMLRAMGFKDIRRFHMNEGHAGLLTLELVEELNQQRPGDKIAHETLDIVRQQCIFTTHTPVPAGHDQFPMDLVRTVLGEHEAFALSDVICCDGVLNMTHLALTLSHYVNGVAKKHGEISRTMFANYSIDSITNGVHAQRWTADAFKMLYDRHIPGWKEDNFSLRYALSIPPDEIWHSHMAAKKELIHVVNRINNQGMDLETFTIGFARRATAYKRPNLIFTELDRLQQVSRMPIQLVFAGKAHPNDHQGKDIIRRIFAAGQALQGKVKLVYIPNYDMEIGRLITSGVDIWLNTPEPPMEASGTSGMKAALNGVPSLSILDGWWIEGCIEGITGWAIGAPVTDPPAPQSSRQDAESLYGKLEKTILPLFYEQRDDYISVMAHAIALNGSFFNTQRMVQQYVLRGYLL